MRNPPYRQNAYLAIIPSNVSAGSVTITNSGQSSFAIFEPVFHAMVKEAAIPQVELIKIMRQADAAVIPRRAIVTQLFALTRTHSY